MREGEADASLRLGLTAKVSVITSVKDDAVIIPYEAVLSDGDGDYVMIVVDGKVEPKRLRSAGRVADGLVVDAKEWSGRVVITETRDVEEGMSVNVKEESA